MFDEPDIEQVAPFSSRKLTELRAKERRRSEYEKLKLEFDSPKNEDFLGLNWQMGEGKDL